MRRIAILIGLLGVLAAITDTAEAARRKRPRAAGGKAAFSDEAVEEAIKRCQKFLLSARNKGGTWPPYGNGYPIGPTALAAYALMESGIHHRDLKPAMDMLAKADCKKTYELGCRANAFLAAMEQGGTEYRKNLAKDVERLIKSTSDGSYTYVSDGTPRAGDNSNSQYGLLGVWAGALAEIEGIPTEYWQKVLYHWEKSQCADGGWAYRGRSGSKATMTAAGLASLFVCYDNLQFRGAATSGRRDKQQHIEKGLEWFEKNFQRTLGGGGWFYYYLYGVERVGLASGYKYFGTDPAIDWYKLGATRLLQLQSANGAWGSVVNSSFALLFLIRGRQPVLFNKLEYEGDWNNYPRECAYLMRWMSKTGCERDVSWQIINLDVPVEEWHDAPILYISGSEKPEFSEEELDKLRTFVWQGGTILSAATSHGRGFGDGMREVYKKLFPNYQMTVCKPEHKVYNCRFKLRGRPRLAMVTNGVRPLAIHTDYDVAKDWQYRRMTTRLDSFHTAANIYKYVTNTTLRHRGVTLWPDKPNFEPKKTVKLARLKHNGNYDPEPLAYERFARLLGDETEVKLEVVGPIPIGQLPTSGAKVATLTGTDEFKLSADEVQALKDFLEEGGILVIDAAGGSKEFSKSAATLLRAFAEFGFPRTLMSSSPIYKVPDYPIEQLSYRTKSPSGGGAASGLQTIMVWGQPGVIYTRKDITCALVGYPSYTCDGYDPDSAYELMRNIVLYAARG